MEAETIHRRTISAGFAGSGEGATKGLALIGLLVTDAGRRLRLFTGIGMGIFAAGLPLAVLVPPVLGKPAVVRHVMLALCVFLLLLSLGVHAIARRREVGSALLIRLGLFYVVVAAGAMAGAETILSAERIPDWDGVSGIAVWIVLFPLIIPCLPGQALVASLSCASMLPLFYCAQLAFGGARLPGEVLVKWWGPVYFCAGLSFAAALSIRRTAKALAAAREEVRDVGRYELVEKLSEGGMGQVWRARHRFLPHDVAVKMIRPAAEAGGSSSAAADLVRRFHLEAQAVAMLTSPNTVHLFDYGVSESGELFAVMEYLNGLDLKRLVEEHGVLPPGRVVHLLGQICLSLAEAHEKGLVHRDLKPANLMVCRLGCQSDFVKVLDFGLVGAMSHFPESLTGDEKTSTVSGTPGFIAPEVLRSGAASERSDLYSLGVVAYWLLTGTTLFPRDDGGEEIGRHLTDVPEDPGKRRGAPVPADLTAIVLRLLEKDPARRPASALELRREVRAVGAAGTWTEEEAKRWWDEHHDR